MECADALVQLDRRLMQLVRIRVHRFALFELDGWDVVSESLDELPRRSGRVRSRFFDGAIRPGGSPCLSNCSDRQEQWDREQRGRDGEQIWIRDGTSCVERQQATSD